MYEKLIHFTSKTPFRKLVASSFLFVLAWRILLEVINQIIVHTTHVVPFWPAWLQWVVAPANAPPFGLGNWDHWDGYHFLSIVLHGYHQVGPGGLQPETAFFPAFPILIRVSSKVTHLDPVIVGLMINFVLSVVVAVAVYKLAILMCERYLPKAKLDRNRVARLSVLLLFLYPASFFLAAFYADALVVAAATLAIYWALQERYVLASLGAFTVMSTKTTGLVLIPTLLMILLENERVRSWRQIFSWSLVRKAVILMSGLAVGLGGYMIYLKKAFGDPMMFSHVESLWGRQNSIWFVKRLYTNYYSQIPHPAHFYNAYQYISIIIVMLLPFLTIGLAVWYGVKFKAYWLPMFTSLTMIIPIVSGIMESLNRYTLILTPLAVALATALLYRKANRYLIAGILVVFAGLLCYFAGGFLNGNYFAG